MNPLPAGSDLARRRLEALIEEGEKLDSGPKSISWDGLHYIEDEQALCRWPASAKHLVEVTLDRDSNVYALFEQTVGASLTAERLRQAVGVLRGLADEWNAGLLRNRELLVSADLFEDSLELAEYLLDKGYKDPAAVVVGAVLESALRKMCRLRSIPLGGRETLEPLNVALAKHDPPAYNAAMFKQITAWGNIRNDAAHGRWDEYNAQQANLMLQGVRNFIATQLS
jgi:hypothetical protein